MSEPFEATLDRYAQAGRISVQLRPLTRRLVAEGASIADICETIEGEIRSLGAKPAFPVNVCVGSTAAHFTATPDGGDVLKAGDLVKVDYGAMVDGYLVDTAISVNLSPLDAGIVKATEDCLEVGIRYLRAGIDVSKIGAAIQQTAEASGLRVISNLTGHQISRYNLHAGGIIPNVARGFHGKVQANVIYAIEPFLTYSHGAGFIVERSPACIFRLGRSKPREPAGKALYSRIYGSHSSLPFAERWLGLSSEEREVFRHLIDSGYITPYPQLVEKNGAVVAQAEHTVAVLPDKAIVLTK
jgi:methionyl aminopeptidase